MIQILDDNMLELLHVVIDESDCAGAEAASNIKLEVEHTLGDIIQQTLDAQYQDM